MKYKNMKFIESLIDWIIGGILGVLIYNLLISDEPEAIDVYQGETTLEITYRDSIPIDSVVVFRME